MKRPCFVYRAVILKLFLVRGEAHQGIFTVCRKQSIAKLYKCAYGIQELPWIACSNGSRKKQKNLDSWQSVIYTELCWFNIYVLYCIQVSNLGSILWGTWRQ